MGIVFKNNAKTTLASSLSNSATSATVTDGSVFPSLNAGEHFLITFDDGTNNEICKCTARSGNTLTIVRAQESTTARSFSSGDAAEGRVTAGVLETIQENIAAKSANQTVFNATTSGNATTYNIGVNPGVEANAMVFLNGVLQHHDTISFSGVNLTFDAAPPNGMALEVIVDNLINLQSSNLTVDSFTAADVGGSPQTAFTLSDTPAAETNLIVFVDGVFQDQDAYTISSNTLTITTGVIAGRGVTVYIINPVNIGTPSDGTVTSAKLSGNITTPGTLTVGSHDVAFDSPTFFVDHTNSRVGLGTASPSVPVDIVGDVKMSANLTVDTTTLVVDSSNNRVGIGLTSLTEKFEVNGSINSSNQSSSFDTGSYRVFMDMINSSKIARIGTLDGANTASGTQGEVSFLVNGSERMRIDSSGNILMNKTTHNQNNTSGVDITAEGAVVATNDGGVSFLGNRTSSDGIIILLRKDNTTTGSIGTSGTSMTFGTGTNGAEKMRIDSKGNLIIGAPTDLTSSNTGRSIVQLGVPRLTVGSAASMTMAIYDVATELSHTAGSSVTDAKGSRGTVWRTTSGQIYGPYVDLPRGQYRVSYRIKCSDNTSYENAVRLQVYAVTSGTVNTRVTQRLVTCREFETTTDYQTFSLDFDVNSDMGNSFEIYGFSQNSNQIDWDYVMITPETDSYGRKHRGIVTTPDQPAFKATRSTGNNWSVATSAGVYTQPFNTAAYNFGSNYSTSTYKFTAPVEGLYMFTHQCNGYGVGTDETVLVQIRAGGTDYYLGQISGDTPLGSADQYATGSVQVHLTVGQTAEAQVNVVGGSSVSFSSSSIGAYNAFSGYLIG